MWTIVYIASHVKTARRLMNALAEEGILCRMDGAELPPGSGQIEILVPESEAEDALEILNQRLGAGFSKGKRGSLTIKR